jgi:hypothetical protein
VFDVASAGSVGLIALTLLFAHRVRFRTLEREALWVSAVGGSSAAFVFIVLLPKLSAAHTKLQAVAGSGLLKYLSSHSFLLGLIGLLLFWSLVRVGVVPVRGMVDTPARPQRKRLLRSRGPLWQPLLYAQALAFACYTMLVGYFVGESPSRDYPTLGLFSLAMALHVFAMGLALSHDLGEAYVRFERWLLATAVLVGWALAQLTEVPFSSLALWNSLFAGMLIFFVIKSEIPSARDGHFIPLLLGAAGYSALALVMESM